MTRPRLRRAAAIGIVAATATLAGVALMGLGRFLDPPLRLDGGSAVVPVHRTGTHWGVPGDMRAYKRIGYDFAVRSVDPRRPSEWRRELDAARSQGLKLLIGAHPEPYSYAEGRWRISTAGVRFLRYLKSRSELVLALFVYNEPYWVNPFTGRRDLCGALSAAMLRSLRTKIRTVWPAAKIYHDIGRPSRWAPGGSLHETYECIGDKYVNSRGIADYVGAWYFPFRESGYRRSEGLAVLERESAYISESMGAVTVWLSQAYACCEDLVWPTDAELLNWNCTVRWSLPEGSLLSWYVWRQQEYRDYLANHPRQWRLTTADAC
jgi:hypothetical protein